MSAEILRLRQAQGTDPPLSDEALARACAAGDATAVAALFDRFRQPVTRYLHRLVGGGPDVEDLLQTTFLCVARGRSVYDGNRASVLTWLFAIATNVVRHHRRSTARRVRLLAAVAQSQPPRSPDATENVDQRRKIERAQQALRSLSDELREAFVLCELEGLSAKQAGEILGASEAAVWKRVSKARKSIRDCVLRGAG